MRRRDVRSTARANNASDILRRVRSPDRPSALSPTRATWAGPPSGCPFERPAPNRRRDDGPFERVEPRRVRRARLALRAQEWSPREDLAAVDGDAESMDGRAA